MWKLNAVGAHTHTHTHTCYLKFDKFLFVYLFKILLERNDKRDVERIGNRLALSISSKTSQFLLKL